MKIMETDEEIIDFLLKRTPKEGLFELLPGYPIDETIYRVKYCGKIVDVIVIGEKYLLSFPYNLTRIEDIAKEFLWKVVPLTQDNWEVDRDSYSANSVVGKQAARYLLPRVKQIKLKRSLILFN